MPTVYRLPTRLPNVLEKRPTIPAPLPEFVPADVATGGNERDARESSSCRATGRFALTDPDSEPGKFLLRSARLRDKTGGLQGSVRFRLIDLGHYKPIGAQNPPRGNQHRSPGVADTFRDSVLPQHRADHRRCPVRQWIPQLHDRVELSAQFA
jgi:hypothetical protein